MPTSRTASLILLLLLGMPFQACGSVPAEPADRLEGVKEGHNIAPDLAEQVQLQDLRALLDEGKHEEARGPLAEMVAERPELALARQLLGRAILAGTTGDPLDLDQLQDAETELLAATRLDPQSSEAWLDLGRLYEAEGHMEGALDSYRRSLHSNVYYKPGLLAAARLATDLGEERDAIRHLEVLRARPPVPEEVSALEARCYLILSEAIDQTQNQKEFLERAFTAFTEISERKPNQPEGWAGQAYCLVRMAQKGFTTLDEERIINLYDEAASLDPTSPWPNYNMGLFLESDVVKKDAEAIENYRRALERKADHLPSLLNLAALYRKGGKTSPAKELYQRALPLLKDQKERKRVLELIQEGDSPDKG